MALERLVESGSFVLKDLKALPIKESVVLEERETGKKFTCIKAYEANVSRFIKNANGRIYTRKLWEKVIAEQREVWEGSLGLADHPLDEEEGSVKNVFGVWRNLRIDENEQTVKADLYLVGNYGRLAQDILEAGGRIGFSSSGYGELSEDGSGIVKEDTYILERVSDWVLHPSQDVWAVKENALEDEESEKVEERVQPNSIQEKVMKDSTMSNKMSPKEIRKFKEDIVGWMKKAESITDLQEKLAELTEILSYFSEDVAVDLKAEVEKQIKETQDKINLAIKEHGLIKETFKIDTVEELKEGIKKVATDTQLFERDASEWKAIAEGLQDKLKKTQSVLAVRPTNEAYQTALDFARKVEAKFKKREDELLAIIEKADSEITKYKSIQKEMVKELEDASKALKESRATAKMFYEKALSFHTKIKKYEEEQKKEKKILEDRKAEKEKINIHPVRKLPEQYIHFNESSEIEDYYEDLKERHGEDILPFEESIKSCKSLKEAMLQYTKILSNLGRKETQVISKALPIEERQKIIETRTNQKIKTSVSLQDRLPPGWD